MLHTTSPMYMFHTTSAERAVEEAVVAPLLEAVSAPLAPPPSDAAPAPLLEAATAPPPSDAAVAPPTGAGRAHRPELQRLVRPLTLPGPGLHCSTQRPLETRFVKFFPGKGSFKGVVVLSAYEDGVYYMVNYDDGDPLC